jgi:hypothetical protein
VWVLVWLESVCMCSMVWVRVRVELRGCGVRSCSMGVAVDSRDVEGCGVHDAT